MEYYKKDKKYISELYNKFSNKEEFKYFEKNFKNFSKEEVIKMYIVKKSSDIKGFDKDIDVEKIDKIKTLYNIGNFLDSLGNIDELIKKQNAFTIHEIGYTLGVDEKSNPFIINKEEVMDNFATNLNINKSEENINFKYIFWINRYSKELESLKQADFNRIISEKDINNRKVKNNLYKMLNKIAYKNSNFYHPYLEFLNGKINKSEFEKTDEFQKMKEIISENKEKKKIDYNPYEMFNMASLNTNINMAYIEKSYLLREICIKKNNLTIETYDDEKIKNNGFKVININSNKDKFNSSVCLHARIEDIEILEKEKNSNIKNISNEEKKSNFLKSFVLTEFSDRKIDNIKKVIRKEDSYINNKTSNIIINQYKDLLGIEVKKKQQSKQSKKLNDLKNKYSYGFSNDIENKLLKEIRDKDNKNIKDDFERGDR